MARIVYTPNPQGLQQLVKGIGSTFVRRQIAPALRREIAKRAPGSLKSSVQIRPSPAGAEVGYFGAAAEKARLVSSGTNPHVIHARSSRGALVFFWDKVGAKTVVPRKGLSFTGHRNGVFWIGKGFINHPGTEPNDFIQDALTAVRSSGRFFRGAGGRFASGARQ